MHLNTLTYTEGTRTARKRVGRGIGSGLGKTCTRGHKGQRARKSGNARIGFEGGQMPMHRRIPKSGFRSRIASEVAEVRLHELTKVKTDTISLEELKKHNLVSEQIKRVKIILSGEINRKVTLSGAGIKATAGAKAAIEAAGGKVEA